MEEKSRRAKAMLRGDILILGVFLAVLLGVNGFILVQALPLLTQGSSWILIVPFAAAMCVLFGTLIKVGVHLYQNRDTLYEEERYYREIARQSAEGER